MVYARQESPGVYVSSRSAVAGASEGTRPALGNHAMPAPRHRPAGSRGRSMRQRRNTLIATEASGNEAVAQEKQGQAQVKPRGGAFPFPSVQVQGAGSILSIRMSASVAQAVRRHRLRRRTLERTGPESCVPPRDREWDAGNDGPLGAGQRWGPPPRYRDGTVQGHDGVAAAEHARCPPGADGARGGTFRVPADMSSLRSIEP